MSEVSAVVEFEKSKVNIWVITGIVATFVTNAFGLGVLYNQQQHANETAVTNITSLQRDVATLKDQMPETRFRLDSLSTVSGENRATSDEINKRIDRVVESFGGKLDGIVEGVNALTTRVEVLSSRLGQNSERPQPTSIRSR